MAATRGMVVLDDDTPSRVSLPGRTTAELSSIRPSGGFLNASGMSLFGSKTPGAWAPSSIGTRSSGSAELGAAAPSGSDISLTFSDRLRHGEDDPTELLYTLSREGNVTAAEKDLWLLSSMLVKDAATTHDPTALGLERCPATRRWHISQNAHAQDVLHRCHILRRLNVVLRWLELTSTKSDKFVVGGTAQTSAEKEALLQAVLDRIRAGQHLAARKTAEQGGDAGLSAALSFVTMRKKREKWWETTTPIELFGEYGLTPEQCDCDSNDHRAAALSTYYDKAYVSLEGRHDSLSVLNSAIFGAVSGHQGAVMKAFSTQPHWTDRLWCELRSRLVHIFMRTHQPYSDWPPNSKLLEAVATTCGGTGAGWMESAQRVTQDAIISLLRQFLSQKGGLLSDIERLQVKTILLFISDGSDQCLFSTSWNQANSRLLATAYAAFDMAEQHRFLPDCVAPQRTPHFAHALISHVKQTINQAPAMKARSIVDFAFPLLGRVDTKELRADGYAKLLVYVRNRALASSSSVEQIEAEETAILQLLRKLESAKKSSTGGEKPVMEIVLEKLSNPASLDLTNVSMVGAQPNASPLHEGDVFHRHGSTFGGEDEVGAAEVSAALDQHSILTSHHKCETVAWLSMTDDLKKLPEIFEMALGEMLALWEQGEHNGVKDVVDILGRRVVSRLDQEETFLHRFAFWDAVSSSTLIRSEYDQVMGDLQRQHAAGTAGKATKLADLTKKEAHLRTAMYNTSVQALETSDAFKKSENPPEGVSRAPGYVTGSGLVAGPMAHTLADFAECCTLALKYLPPEKLAQQALTPPFKLLARFESTGRMDQELGTGDAKNLMTALRTLRAAYTRRLHQDRVAAEVQKQQAQQQAIGGQPHQSS